MQVHPRRHARRGAWSIALSTLVFSGSAWSQAPDAGAILQRSEADRRVPLLPALTPAPSASRPNPVATGDAVVVTRFRFDGNTLLDDARLSAATAEYLGRPLDLAGLRDAAVRVTEAYRSAGWIVRAFLPPQEVSDGEVTIAVVESVFGKAVIERTDGVRLGECRAERLVGHLLSPGAPLSARAVDRALLLIGDIPGVAVDGRLQEGAGERETDLIAALRAEPLVSGDAALDNAGSRSTGERRLLANLQLNGPLATGDLWGVSLLAAHGVRYVRLSQSVPIGWAGWRAGLHATHLTYRVTSFELAPLAVRGSSTGVGFDAQYPLVRSSASNLYLLATAETRRFFNEALASTTSRYRSHAFGVGVSANAVDWMGTAGITTGSVSLARGRLDLDGSPTQAADAATARTEGGYARVRYAASHQWSLTEDLAASIQVAGQSASRNLDSSEKFYLGGAGGVRAYPSGEAGGSRAWLLNLEVRKSISPQWTLAAFHDRGSVTQNVDNAFPGAPTPNRYSLSGVGLWLGWQPSAATQLRVTWSRRTGRNPNPTAAGTDQDGTLRRHRVWLLASMVF